MKITVNIDQLSRPHHSAWRDRTRLCRAFPIGKRVIATAQLEQIWRSDRGEPLARHNCYNAFVGGLLIPELPRGVLPTLNNKTGLDQADSGWQNLCGKLNEYMPPKSVRDMSEERLKQRWMGILQAACPTDKVTDECGVWPTGTRIDVVAEAPGKRELYELKVGKAEPQNLYQLKMYWDGLVLQGRQPTHGTLPVQNYSSDRKLMLDQMNQLPPPLAKDGRLYRLPSKRLQSEMALKSGMNYQGKPMHFVLRDTWGLELPEQELYKPHFRANCQKCASRMICNGCSDCGQCERK